MNGDDAATAPRRLSRDVGKTIFGADVAGYAAARIGYPPQLYAAIRARCPVAAPAVVEIGPGTGLATSEMLAELAPGSLVAIEPDQALCHHLEQTIPDPRLRVINAGFVESGPVGPFDLACCAAAFHWLEPDAAFARLREVVRPDGVVAIWWNCYRQTGIGDTFADAVVPLLAEVQLAPSEAAAGHYSLDVDHHRAAFARAGLTGFEPHQFRRERRLTTAQVCALFASYSYVRAMPDDARARLLDAVARLAEREFGGDVPNVTLTALYLGNAPGR